MALYIAILIFIGIVLLVLEILIIPGLVAGIIGALFLLIAISWTFHEYGTTAGIITGSGTVLLTGLSIYIALRSKAWNRFSLKDDLSLSRANVLEDSTVTPGSKGITVSALRPMGTVLINDKKIEARTNGEHIHENKRVIVIKVLGNGVVVKSEEEEKTI